MVKAAIGELEQADWLAGHRGGQGKRGRPKVTYTVNPKLWPSPPI